MSGTTETTRTMRPAPDDRGRWYPPDYWTGSDGCTGVRDYVFGRSCRRHDWRWRYSMWAISQYWTRFGLVGLVALALSAIPIMTLSNLFYLCEQYGDLVRSRHWRNPLLWLFPIWRFAAVMLTGFIFFNVMGDGR